MDKIKEWFESFLEFPTRRKILIVILVLLIIGVLVLVGILMNNPSKPVQEELPAKQVVLPEVTTPEATTKTQITTAETTQPEYSYTNPLTGLGVTEEEHKVLEGRRPLLVSYDNLNDAWPQSGVSHADYYIEVLAEGLITRFLCVYYGDAPEIIGPIRSARPYIVLKALEHDAYLAHVGGSMQALTDIQNYGVADLDGLWSGAFNRMPPKLPPHNTYAYYNDLMAQAESLGYRMSSEPEFYDFGEDKKHLKDADSAEFIKFSYRDPGLYDSVGYNASYQYDGKTGCYTRQLVGEVQHDEHDDGTIEVSNILVQYAYHEVLDDAGRLAIDLYQGGDAYLFRDGKVVKLKWSKDEMTDLTRFYYEDGSDVILAPGKTALHIVYQGILSYE